MTDLEIEVQRLALDVIRDFQRLVELAAGLTPEQHKAMGDRLAPQIVETEAYLMKLFPEGL